jgi:hypothetical protein
MEELRKITKAAGYLVIRPIIKPRTYEMQVYNITTSPTDLVIYVQIHLIIMPSLKAV